MRGTGLQRKDFPLYLQLEQILRSQIMTGELLQGQQIPTEKELSKTYRVSTITVRQAVLKLVNDGLLSRKQGKGTFVMEHLPPVKNIMTLNARGNIDEIVPEGITAQKAEVLDIESVRAPKRVAESLSVPEGTDIVRIRRTRSDGGVPVSYIRNYLIPDIAARISREDLLQYPMMHLLKNKLGIPLKRGLQYIGAISADHEVASHLSVSVSSPVLFLETTIFAEGDRRVEFVQTFHRSDPFKYTVHLDLDELPSDVTALRKVKEEV
ncbi:MAG: GntR family transcriptional regulator [Deltaproteobacteria bacterium]|nr:GntR family transcriptional regulator [Deltaproteobacteria bacterium]